MVSFFIGIAGIATSVIIVTCTYAYSLAYHVILNYLVAIRVMDGIANTCSIFGDGDDYMGGVNAIHAKRNLRVVVVVIGDA